MTRARIGVFGGTFDPVHAGHLDLAARVATALHLDHVRLVANRTPPHKAHAVASAAHRHAMLALAAAGTSDLVPDPLEVERAGPSYTIDTLLALRDRFDQAELFLLVGADSLRDLTSWRRWQEVLEQAIVVSTGRSGVDVDAAARSRGAEVASGRVVVVGHEPPPWSSTALREALAAGMPLPEGALTDAVLDYIRKNELYTTPGAAPPPVPEIRD